MDYYDIIFFEVYKKCKPKKDFRLSGTAIFISYLVFASCLLLFYMTKQTNYKFGMLFGIVLIIASLIWFGFDLKKIQDNVKDRKKEEIVEFADELKQQNISLKQIDIMHDITKERLELDSKRKEKISNVSITVILMTGIAFIVQIFMEIFKFKAVQKEKILEISIESLDANEKAKEVVQVYNGLISEYISYLILALILFVLGYLLFRLLASSFMSMNLFNSYNEKLLNILNGVKINQNNDF